MRAVQAASSSGVQLSSSARVVSISERPVGQALGLKLLGCAALAARDPEHDAAGPKGVSYSMSREKLRALLEHWAVFFHAHAAELLDDQTATSAAIKAWRKKTPDPYP